MEKRLSTARALGSEAAHEEPDLPDTWGELPASLLGWKELETAPTNTSVLVFIPNADHYGPGIYRAMQVDMGTGRRWMVTGLHMGKDCGEHYAPTHWMPLPEPPNT